jgi:hypothetical protein
MAAEANSSRPTPTAIASIIIRAERRIKNIEKLMQPLSLSIYLSLTHPTPNSYY